MRIIQSWYQPARSRWLSAIAAVMAVLTTGATLPSETPIPFQSMDLAGVTIHFPSGSSRSPIIVVPRRYPRRSAREVLVRFVAQGDDWASVYLDNRLLFRANNTRRDQQITLDEGAYHLTITGVSKFDVWASGYLDVGRGGSNIVVVRYGRGRRLRVSGDPEAWIPD